MKLRWRHTKWDRRCHKEYGKKTIAYVSIPSAKIKTEWETGVNPTEIMKAHLKGKCDKWTVKGLKPFVGTSWEYNDILMVGLQITVEVDKPRNIRPDKGMKELFPPEDQILQWAEEAVTVTMEACVKANQEVADVNLADRAIKHYKYEAEKEAKTNIRFEQRLAGLVAEFKAEVESVLGTKTKEYQENLKEHDNYTDRVGELFAEYFEHYCGTHASSGLPSRFPSSGNNWLQKHLYELREQTKDEENAA